MVRFLIFYSWLSQVAQKNIYKNNLLELLFLKLILGFRMYQRLVWQKCRCVYIKADIYIFEIDDRVVILTLETWSEARGDFIGNPFFLFPVLSSLE